MNFLNEVAMQYPNAISFASGRPTEKYFDLKSWLDKVPMFIEYFASSKKITYQKASALIGQYGKTDGIINSLISEQLQNDQVLQCSSEQIIVTTGCQEAMAICLATLMADKDSVVLVFNPNYIGITGLAAMFGECLSHVDVDDSGDFLGSVSRSVERIASSRKIIKAIYLVPDFNNPTGEVLPEAQRQELISFCSERKILILEDNAYGMFRYEGIAQRSMYSLDTTGTVLYLGTYSKTLCPSLRIGFIVLPKVLFGDTKASRELSEALSIAKSFITVNTSQLSQAVVGGILISEGMTLKRLTALPLNHYKTNLDTMTGALKDEFFNISSSVRWNKPEGGFFLTVKFPFEFNEIDLKACAEQYNVLCMPMSFFAFDNRYDNQIRLAFSNVETEKIAEGISNLAAYSRVKLSITGPSNL